MRSLASCTVFDLRVGIAILAPAIPASIERQPCPTEWPMSKLGEFVRSLQEWSDGEFVIRLNELLALALSLSLMAVIAAAAFVACAVLQ